MYNTTVNHKGFDFHNGMAFTTIDRDQDNNNGNCAALFGGGGWWHNSCHHVNLNGNMTTSGFFNNQQMRYGDGEGIDWMMLSSSEMRMIRVG